MKKYFIAIPSLIILLYICTLVYVPSISFATQYDFGVNIHADTYPGSGGYGFGGQCQSGPPRNFAEFVCFLISIVQLLIPLLAALALLLFFYGIVVFIYKAGHGDELTNAKNTLFWGIIALFVMVSLWGIVSYLSGDLFGTTNIGIPRLPLLNEY
jgi:cbb3-type cytochrome oxidase subunit 3